MNKKIRILLMTLALFCSGAATTTNTAASLIPEVNGIFSPIGNFFSSLFGGEKTVSNDELRPLTQEEKEKNGTTTYAGSGDVTNKYATNTAYGKDGDGNEESGTGAIELSDKVVGLYIDKTAIGSDPARPGQANDPVTVPAVTDGKGILPGDQINYEITVTNTGRNEDATTFNVSDDLASVYGVVAPTAEEFTLTADVDNGDPIAAGSTKVSDLQTGVEFTNVNPGDVFTISFSLTVSSLAMDDEWSQNTTKVCMPVEDTVTDSLIHFNDEENRPDGILSGTSGDKFLCNDDMAQVYIDGDGDGHNKPDLPELPFTMKKSVESETVDTPTDIADYGEKLTYTFKLTNYDLSTPDSNSNIIPDKKFKLQDKLDLAEHPSLVNLDIKDTITLSSDSSDIDGKTIADLKAGISNVTLDAFVTTTVSFDVNTKAEADWDIIALEDIRIKNTATLTDAADSAKQKVDTAEIDTNVTNSLADINIEKDLLPTTGAGAGTVAADGKVDDSKFNNDIDKAGQAGLEYKVSVTNTSFDRTLEYIQIGDILPAQSYIANNLTNNEGEVLTTDAGGNTISVAAGTVGALVNTGIKIDEFLPRSTITLTFKIYFSEPIFTSAFTDMETDFPADSGTFTNRATVCDYDSGYSASEGCKFGTATGYIGDNSIKPGNDALASIDKSSVAEDPSLDLGEGKNVIYTIAVTNDTEENQVFNLYDQFEDPALRDEAGDLVTPDAALVDLTSSAGAGSAELGTYDWSTEAFTEKTDFKASDLNTENTVFIKMTPKSTATFNFTMTLSGERPEAGDLNPAGSVENTADVCWENVGAIDSTTMIEGKCNEDTDSIELATVDALTIEKTSEITTDGGVAGTLDAGDVITYTIKVHNDSTSNDVKNYNVYDLMSNANLDMNTVSDVTLTDGDGAPDYVLTLEEKEKFFNAGIGYDSSVGRAKVDTYTYSVSMKDPIVNPGSVSNQACTNIQPRLFSKVVTDDDVCATAIDNITGFVPNVTGWNVEKVLYEETDNIAEPDDELKVRFNVSRNTPSGETSTDNISIFEVAGLATSSEFDPNIDWDSSQANTVRVGSTTSSTFAQDEIMYPVGESVGTAVTVADLVTPAPAQARGIIVQLGEGEDANIEFTVKLKPDTDWHPASEVENTIAYCNEGETFDQAEDTTPANGIPDSIEPGNECDSSIATIATSGYENLSVKKYVMDSVSDSGGQLTSYLDGTNDNPTVDATDTNPKNMIPDVTEPTCTPTGTGIKPCIQFYAEDGAKISYKVRATNTGSLPVNLTKATKMVFTDVLNETIFNMPLTSTELVTVKVYDAEFADVTAGVLGTVDPITVVDLQTGNSITGSVTDALLESGYSIDLDFATVLKGDLSDTFETGDNITNVAKVCYTSETAYNVAASTGPGELFCYQSGVDTPFVKGDSSELKPGDKDDADFTINKDITSTGDKLEPGAAASMKIDIINNLDEYDDEGNLITDSSATINVTDLFLDQNFNYEDTLKNTAKELTISNSLTVGSGSTDICSAFTGTISTVPVECKAAPTYRVLNMLPKEAELTSYTQGEEAKKRWPVADYADADRGGITLEIPANQTYTITFDTAAKGTLKTASKVRNFFDFRRFFS